MSHAAGIVIARGWFRSIMKHDPACRDGRNVEPASEQLRVGQPSALAAPLDVSTLKGGPEATWARETNGAASHGRR